MMYRRSEKMQHTVDRLILKVPVIGQNWRRSAGLHADGG